MKKQRIRTRTGNRLRGSKYDGHYHKDLILKKLRNIFRNPRKLPSQASGELQIQHDFNRSVKRKKGEKKVELYRRRMESIAKLLLELVLERMSFGSS